MPFPPTDIDEWIAGGPWLIINKGFFQELMQGILPPAFSLHRGGWNNRDAHELAHCIAARDEDIYKPAWGIPEFTISLDSEGNQRSLSFEANHHEMKVLRIQASITAWTKANGLSGMTDNTIIKNQIINGYGPPHIKAIDYPEIEAYWYSELKKPELQDWNVYRCWEELQHKYNLIKD